MLTIEAQKRLTEFSGEYWHEDFCTCPECTNPDEPPTNRLDFNDWRVVGRLIEKIKELSRIAYSAEDGSAEILETLQESVTWSMMDMEVRTTEAICLAIDSYLQEREKV